MIRLFNEKSITQIFDLTISRIPLNIEKILDYQIQNVDLKELAENTSKHHILKKLEVDFDKRSVDVVMVDLSGNQFPPGTDIRRNQKISCARVDYTFTVTSGDIELLCVRPQGSTFNHNVAATINNNNFTISYQTKYANTDLSEAIKKEVKQNIRAIIDSCKVVVEAINKEIDEFNMKLPQYYFELLESRKKRIQKEINLKNDLNDL